MVQEAAGSSGAGADARIRRLSLGNFGAAKPVGDGISELRIDYGRGYRVYFVQRDLNLIVLLCDLARPNGLLRAGRSFAPSCGFTPLLPGAFEVGQCLLDVSAGFSVP
jgi:hypothetical protein